MSIDYKKEMLQRFKRYEEKGFRELAKCDSRENFISRMECVGDYAIKAIISEDQKECLDVLSDMMGYFLGMLGDLKRGRL